MDRESLKQKILSYYTALRDTRGSLELGNTPHLEELDYRARIFQVLMDATSKCFIGDRGVKDSGAMCEYTENGIDTFRGILDFSLKDYLIGLGENNAGAFRDAIGQLEAACAEERQLFQKFFPFVKPGEFAIPEPKQKKVSA